ncbi:Vacuolar fusion protein MON1 A [Orchesella cincta]|uniref:Vacuolar fusion protein MON1 homolog n=1 Tax=Orchesella cincta TaxID=48709 RepID=A0A1D2MUG4_ORCCI|nr:Vacuolar fusion protein MON1 A [Orchesella cincta]
MDKSSSSVNTSGGDLEEEVVSEIPLESEPLSHRKLSDLQNQSGFITDDNLNGIIGESVGGENIPSGDDNADGNAFSSCIGSFGTKEDEEQQASSDPEALNVELTKALDDLSVTTSGSESEQVQSNGLENVAMRDDNDSDMSPLWRSQKRHVFILSEAGKPIYSRHGNEEKMVTFFGLLQALVSFVQSDGDTIRAVKVGETNIVFLVKSPLILVCVSQMSESISQIETHLMYFHNQIISILTSKQLQTIFEKRKNYDLRRLLSGSERLLNNLAGLIEVDPSFVLGAVRCLPLANTVRDSISQTITTILNKHKPPPSVVFALLVANNQLVSIVRMKKVFMHPMDLHIILNLIDASESFISVDSWVPICLPRFDSSGFMYAHVSYLAEDCQACLILLTTDRNSFFTLSEAKQKIVDRLRKQNCLDAINASMNNQWPTMSYVNVPEVRHFLYKAKYRAQFVAPVLDVPYLDHNSEDEEAPPEELSRDCPRAAKRISGELQRLYSTYYRMHSRLHAQARPVKIIYWVDDKENWLGWNTSNFELYVALEPLIKKSAAISAVNKLLKWVKKEEERIFIVNAPTF